MLYNIIIILLYQVFMVIVLRLSKSGCRDDSGFSDLVLWFMLKGIRRLIMYVIPGVSRGFAI